MAHFAEDLRFRGLIHQMTDPETRAAARRRTGHRLQRIRPDGRQPARRSPAAGVQPAAAAAGRAPAHRRGRWRHRIRGRPGGQVRGAVAAERTSSCESNLAGIRGQLERFLDFSGDATPGRGRCWSTTPTGSSRCRSSTSCGTWASTSPSTRWWPRTRSSPAWLGPTRASPTPSSATCSSRPTTSSTCSTTYGCRLQIGGSDQWGNITMGIELIRKVRQQEVVGSDHAARAQGRRHQVRQDRVRDGVARRRPDQSPTSSTSSSCAARTPWSAPTSATSPSWTTRTIRALDEATADAPERREAQRVLAREVCTLVHGSRRDRTGRAGRRGAVRRRRRPASTSARCSTCSPMPRRPTWPGRRLDGGAPCSSTCWRRPGWSPRRARPAPPSSRAAPTSTTPGPDDVEPDGHRRRPGGRSLRRPAPRARRTTTWSASTDRPELAGPPRGSTPDRSYTCGHEPPRRTIVRRSSPVRLTTGLPETVLPEEPEAVRTALAGGAGPAGRAPPPRRVRRGPRRPRSLDAWAALGSLARDDVEAYACFRVGLPPRSRRPAGSGLEGIGPGPVGARVEPGVPPVPRRPAVLRPAPSASTPRRSGAPSSCASSTRRGSPDWTGYPGLMAAVRPTGRSVPGRPTRRRRPAHVAAAAARAVLGACGASAAAPARSSRAARSAGVRLGDRAAAGGAAIGNLRGRQPRTSTWPWPSTTRPRGHREVCALLDQRRPDGHRQPADPGQPADHRLNNAYEEAAAAGDDCYDGAAGDAALLGRSAAERTRLVPLLLAAVSSASRRSPGARRRPPPRSSRRGGWRPVRR